MASDYQDRRLKRPTKRLRDKFQGQDRRRVRDPTGIRSEHQAQEILNNLEKPKAFLTSKGTRKVKLPERAAEHCVDLLRAFNKEDVEYLIGGSMARSHYYSVPRVRDMDVVINPTLENATKVKPVLDDFMYRLSGFMVKNFTLEDVAKPGKRVRLGNVDLFTARPEVDFPKAFSRSIAVDVVDGLRARIVSEDDLEIIIGGVPSASDGANRAQARS